MLTEPNILQEQISQQIERRGSRGRPGSWPLQHRTGTVVSVAAPTASGVPNAAAGASAAAAGGGGGSTLGSCCCRRWGRGGGGEFPFGLHQHGTVSTPSDLELG